MSFSGDVKRELGAVNVNPRHCRIAEWAGLMAFCGRVLRHYDGSRTFLIQTENMAVAYKCSALLYKTFKINAQVRVRRLNVHRDSSVYFLVVDDDEQVENILQTVKWTGVNIWQTEFSEPVDARIIVSECCRRSFLRGAFLASGSISNPVKSYHFEIVCHSQAQALQLQNIINGFDMDAKVILRKKYFVVYVKESEQIVDLLNIMGAHQALLDLENLRIVKDMRNNVNRQVNCETANLTKTICAAVDQVEAIRYIRDTVGLGKLPEGLQEIAKLRLQYEDASLKELGEMLSEPVGKSGVNHRLRKLKNIAQDIKEQRE